MMKNNAFDKGVVFVLAILGGLLVAGCSPTTNSWIDRGKIGLENNREALADWYVTAAKAEDAKLKALINASFADIRSCRDGKLTDPKTGLQIALSDKWLTEHQAGLTTGFSLWLDNREALRAKYANDLKNIDSVDECFDQIKRLNVAWANDKEMMLTEVNRLAGKIDELKAAQKAAKTTTSTASE